MGITRDDARSAEAAVRWANAAADFAEAETQAARERAAVRAKESAAVVRQWETVETGAKLRAGDELRQLRKQLEGLLAAKPDQARPSVEARGLARLVLRDPAPDPFTMLARLSALDPHYAALAGTQDSVQRFAVRSGDLFDAAINDAADDLEVSCHRAVLARLRWLAGES